jgi:drug/metabolite transporter (DMT)-like permease
MIWRLGLLTLGIFCAASSVVMTKASQLQPEHLSAARLFVAVLILSPLYLRDKKRFPEFTTAHAFKISALPAILLAIHFITWTLGARWTTAANSTLIVNLIPIAMPILGYFILKETINLKELLGTALALVGVCILALTDYRLNAQLLEGDLVCLISMLLVAWYLILARKNRNVPSIWLYIVPLYLTASIDTHGLRSLALKLVHALVSQSIRRSDEPNAIRIRRSNGIWILQRTAFTVLLLSECFHLCRCGLDYSNSQANYA